MNRTIHVCGFALTGALLLAFPNPALVTAVFAAEVSIERNNSS